MILLFLCFQFSLDLVKWHRVLACSTIVTGFITSSTFTICNLSCAYFFLVSVGWSGHFLWFGGKCSFTLHVLGQNLFSSITYKHNRLLVGICMCIHCVIIRVEIIHIKIQCANTTSARWHESWSTWNILKLNVCWVISIMYDEEIISHFKQSLICWKTWN